MNDERQAGFARCFDVSAKALRLRRARRVVVVVIEAGFTECHDFRVASSARSDRRR